MKQYIFVILKTLHCDCGFCVTCRDSIQAEDGKASGVPSGDHERFNITFLADPSEISCGSLSTELLGFCNLFLPTQLKQKLQQSPKLNLDLQDNSFCLHLNRLDGVFIDNYSLWKSYLFCTYKRVHVIPILYTVKRLIILAFCFLL